MHVRVLLVGSFFFVRRCGVGVGFRGVGWCGLRTAQLSFRETEVGDHARFALLAEA